MTKMKSHYATREEMERDQGKIMMEIIEERRKDKNYKPVPIKATNREYNPNKKSKKK